ncbi:hypothetical protein DSECCO2_449560 [anaerobic digester metagenome]
MDRVLLGAVDCAVVLEVPGPGGRTAGRGIGEQNGERNVAAGDVCREVRDGRSNEIPKCIEFIILGSDVEGSVGPDHCMAFYRGGSGVVVPLQGPVRVQCIEYFVVASDVDGSVGTDYWRSADIIPGGEIPFECPVGIDRIDFFIIVARVDGPVGTDCH